MCWNELPPPPKPQIFYKPRHNEDIAIPKIAQGSQYDYEGEFCVVIGKIGKDIKEEEALRYVAGYLAGDDISARTWQ